MLVFQIDPFCVPNRPLNPNTKDVFNRDYIICYMSILCQLILSSLINSNPNTKEVFNDLRWNSRDGSRTTKISSTASGVSVDKTAANSQVFMRTAYSRRQ